MHRPQQVDLFLKLKSPVLISFLTLFTFCLAGSSLLHGQFSLVMVSGDIFSYGARASHWVVSLVAKHRLYGVTASVVVTRGLNSCGPQA